jgi:hypothetical protein
MSGSTTTSTKERALVLLGQGVGPEMVASAIGVSVSAISQLISDPEFAAAVAEARYTNLIKYNERDTEYDKLEDTLLSKLKDLIPYMLRPMEILKAIQVINSAKRRGAVVPESIANPSQVVQLVMPVQILQQFTVNSSNQVIKTGEQELITVQSGQMSKLLEKKRNLQNVQSQPQIEFSPATSS